MSLQPTTGAQPDTPKTCGDTRYPHKHPTLDICYTPAGYKKYLEQNSGAGSADNTGSRAIPLLIAFL